MNRETFRKLKGNETVNVNNHWEGSTRGRQGTILKITDKAKGTIKVKFLERKTPAVFHYSFLDVVQEESVVNEEKELTTEKGEPVGNISLDSDIVEETPKQEVTDAKDIMSEQDEPSNTEPSTES